MFEPIKHFRGVINERLVHKVEGEVSFFEKDKGGKCEVTFQMRGACLKILPHGISHPVAWVAENQCADGAFFTQTLGGLRLHIVEMKSRVGLEKWDSARKQFAGMFWNAWAIARFLGLPIIVDVRCYITYSRDEVRIDRIASPTLIRSNPTSLIQAAEDWRSYKVHLPHAFIAPLTKKIRPDPPVVDFGLVC